MRNQRRGKRGGSFYQNDLVAEGLESRILYSGSPMPDVVQDISFETYDAGNIHSFSTIDEFCDQERDSPIQSESDAILVTLLTFDNLSDSEVSSLVSLNNQFVAVDANGYPVQTQFSSPVELSAPDTMAVENRMLPVVRETDMVDSEQVELDDFSMEPVVQHEAGWLQGEGSESIYRMTGLSG